MGMKHPGSAFLDTVKYPDLCSPGATLISPISNDLFAVKAEEKSVIVKSKENVKKV